MWELARRVPELTFLVAAIAVAYAAMAMFSAVDHTHVLTADEMWLILAASFLFSTLIAVVAVLGGVGGGVLFTPVMLGFTNVDTLLIRSTGLVVAMFSGLVSSGPFMRKGLADVRLVFYCAVPIIVGAILGAKAAIVMADAMGATGDAIVRLMLGALLIFIAVMFVVGGSKTEYPVPRKLDGLSRRLGMRSTYWEESLARPVTYHANRVLPGGLLFLAVGFVGGFFGLGGGWAVVPVLNLVMDVPLKVAAASSGVLLAIGNAAAIWPYITKGALIALFAAPWMLGQVVGGILGAHILARIRAGFVRQILIVLLFLTSIKLVVRGAETLLGFDVPLV